MGLGDFAKGIGEAVGNVAKGAAWVADPHHWDDVAEGVGNAAEFVVENPGKTWDIGFEVARGMAKDQLDPVNLAINAGLLAATVATGGAAAPALFAKVGLGAKSVAAGVTAAKGVETGLEVAKGVDTALDVAKGVKTGMKAVDTTRDILKAGDVAADVVKTADRVGDTAKTIDRVGDVAESVDTAVDAGRTGSKFMKAVDKGLGVEPGKLGTKASNILNPLENSRFGMAAMRERGAANLLKTASGEAPGLGRQIGAALLQGGGRGAGGPAQLAGMSDKVYAVQRNIARAEGVAKRVHQAGQLTEGVEAAANPVGYALEHGGEEKVHDYINERAGSGSGYTDIGQTTTGLYGGDQKAIGSGGQTEAGLAPQTAAGLYTDAGRKGAFDQGTQMAGLSQPQKAIGTGDQTATGMYTATPPGFPPGGTAHGQAPSSDFPAGALPSGPTAGPQATGGQAQSPYGAVPKVDFSGGSGTPPPSSAGTAATATPGSGGPPVTGTSPSGGTYRTGTGSSQPGTTGSQPQKPLEDPGKAPKRKGDWKPSGQHFWEGPRSQWAGGVKANYDWRPVDPLRPIDSGTIQGAKARAGYQAKKTQWGKDKAAYDEQQAGLNEQGAPESFSPEVPKSGMYALSSGQQPQGSLNPGQPTRPEIGAGPTLRVGEARGSRHNLGNVRTLQQPIGAIGPGPKQDNFIDADSSSPDDLKFDNSGQGYFDFSNMGSGTADVGSQPNTGAMYGSRTSRRSTGALGV